MRRRRSAAVAEKPVGSGLSETNLPCNSSPTAARIQARANGQASCPHPEFRSRQSLRHLQTRGRNRRLPGLRHHHSDAGGALPILRRSDGAARTRAGNESSFRTALSSTEQAAAVAQEGAPWLDWCGRGLAAWGGNRVGGLPLEVTRHSFLETVRKGGPNKGTRLLKAHRRR